jgi:hypothetical protein
MKITLPTLSSIASKHVTLLLALVAVLVIIVQQARLATAQRRDIAVGLTQDSVIASHDTTREVVASDSTNIWQQRAIQAGQRADALDRALRQERVARATIALSSPSLDTIVPIPVPGEGQVIREAPFTLSLQARARASPDSGAALAVHLTADTLTLGIRLGCGAPGALGVHSA